SWPRGVWETVGRSEIRLDVEQRRAVDAVDFAHGECHPLDTNKLHGGKRDRVGPHRRAKRKGAAGMTQMCRRLLDKVAPSLVHPVEQPQMAVESQVLEPRRIQRIELDPADGIGFGRVLR